MPLRLFRFTRSNSGMVDFLVLDLGKAKPALVPFSDRVGLLSFAIRTRNLPMATVEEITRERIQSDRVPSSKKRWRSWYSYALQMLRQHAPQYPGILPSRVRVSSLRFIPQWKSCRPGIHPALD